MMSNLRFALRTLSKNRGSSLVIVVTLGVAIAATTVMYSTIDLIWHALPIANTERLVFVASTDPRPSQAQAGMSGGLALTGVSVPDLVDWSEQSTTIEQFAAFRLGTVTLTGAQAPARLSIVRATVNLPSVWGLTPTLGRSFLSVDAGAGAEPVALLTQSFWERQFGSNPAVLGTTVLLDGIAHAVVGVLPAAVDRGIFRGIALFVPHGLDAARSARDERELFVHARLKPGVTGKQAETDLQAIARRLQAEYPRTNSQSGVVVRPYIEQLGGNTPFVTFLLALVGLVTVGIACANVANLLLAQAATRERELAIRAALGAGRLEHIRRFMTEGFLLAAAGGAVGVVLGWWGIASLRWFVSSEAATVLNDMSVNGRVLAMALAITGVVPFAFGLYPALRSSKSDPLALKEGARAAAGGGGQRVRQVLVGLQVAMALVLMVQIAILGRTAWSYRNADTGFDPAQVLTFRIDLPARDYSEPVRAAQFYDDLLARVAAVPGVASAAATSRLPVADGEQSVRVAVEDAPPGSPQSLPFAAYTAVTRDYLETLRIPVLQGRGFTDADFGGGQPVAIVSESAARRFWPASMPIGRRVVIKQPPLPDTPLLVVGVVADVRNSDVDQRINPQVYVPASWHVERAMAIVVRSDTHDALSLMPAIRSRAADVDPNQPLFDVTSMEQVLFDDLVGTYTLVILLAAISAIALCLAAAGIYAVVACSVTQRTREIGVRMAVGARPGSVVRTILAKGALPVAGGAILGLAGALALALSMGAALSEVDARDPLNYLGVAATIAFVAFVASYVPARRAASINPIEALRTE
jgi:putative ABC transport system permease protein